MKASTFSFLKTKKVSLVEKKTKKEITIRGVFGI
jgi:hypothetical protein